MSGAADVRRATPLAAKLKARIAAGGPMTVAAYMRACLEDNEHGYYRTTAPIGRAGDFITAPEISQMFGELVGLWAAVAWQQMGAPGRCNLIELGPGRGTMMADALRATRIVPGFLQAAHVAMVEPNGRLVAEQRRTLAASAGAPTWYATLSDVPARPTILVANEVVDVMPVVQLVKAGGGWRERGVGLNASGELAFVTLATAAVADDHAHAMPSGLAEIAERRDVGWLADELGRRAQQHALAALVIDYGYQGPAVGDTLQAVRGHAYEHALSSPGEADLTAHVDFTALADALRQAGLACDGPVPQAAFLGSLGIAERASRLMAANPAQAGSLEAGVARLMAPTGMGGRFQVLGVRSPALPPLPGLA